MAFSHNSSAKGRVSALLDGDDGLECVRAVAQQKIQVLTSHAFGHEFSCLLLDLV